MLALIGGNGAGKSTLMKIIMGIYSHDKGHMSMNGGAVALNRPSDALARGVYMVPQEPLLFPNMNVEENITIGFDRGKAELHKELGFHLNSPIPLLAMHKCPKKTAFALDPIIVNFSAFVNYAQPIPGYSFLCSSTTPP